MIPGWQMNAKSFVVADGSTVLRTFRVFAKAGKDFIACVARLISSGLPQYELSVDDLSLTGCLIKIFDCRSTRGSHIQTQAGI